MILAFRKCLFVILILVVIVGSTTIAQDNEDTGGLLETISHIPDLPEVRADFVTYVDLDNLLAARLNLPPIEHSSQMSEEAMDALLGIANGPGFLQYLFAMMEDMDTQVGFDFFEINRMASYGLPPATTTMLDVDIDEGVLATALMEYDYEQRDTSIGAMYCHPDSCSPQESSRISLTDRFLLFPIIDELGRYQPVLLTEDYFFMSPAYAMIDTQIAVEAGEVPSLADVPEYRAVAAAIDAMDKPLIQTMFLVQDALTLEKMLPLPADATDEQREEMVADLGLDKSSEELADVLVPPYSLAVIADLDGGDDEITVIALVYEDEESAQQAGSVVLGNLGNMTSLFSQQPFIDLLTERLMLPSMPTVYASGTGFFTSTQPDYYVTLIPFQRPKPTDGASSMGYQLFTRMVMHNDMLWLLSVDGLPKE